MIASLIGHLIGESPILSFHGRTVLVFPELVALCSAGWLLIKRRLAVREVYGKIPPLFRSAGIFLVLGGAISVIVSGNFIAALAAYKAWILFPLLMFFLFIAVPRGGLYARWALYGATAAELLYSMFSAHGHSSDWRLTGTFSSPNYLAMLLAPVLVLLILDVLRAVNMQVRNKLLSLLAIIIIAVALLATKSVGGILSVIGAAVYFLYRSPVRRPVRLAVLCGIFVLGLIGGSLLLSRVQAGQANSVASRLQIWQTATAIGLQQPLLGIGFTNFPRQYVDNVVSVIGHTPIEWSVPLPHNIFLAFWLYLGVLGLAGLCALIWEAGKKGYGLLFLPFLTACIHGLVDTPYFYTPIVYVFWLTLAIGLIDVWQKRHSIFLESSKR